jgi:hypoxanthine phosphoribosyltransferase
MYSQSEPRILINHREIEAAICRLATQINQDYSGRKPVLLAILKGAFVFLADLIRRLDLQVEVEFVYLSSYEHGRESSGKIRVVHGMRIDVKGRDVIVIEDIIDTGLTTDFILDYLNQREPSSVKLCALTSKPSRRQIPVNIDYLGFDVPDKFLIGYGLDYDENFRQLPDICFIEEKK